MQGEMGLHALTVGLVFLFLLFPISDITREKERGMTDVDGGLVRSSCSSSAGTGVDGRPASC